ncbi:MAG: AEC family transporter [Oscillospiraceae bacterium]|nr:AEC family transporter [Oscillospiraceae bacterium]
MREVLILQFSFFVMIALGFMTRRLGIVSPKGQKEITDLIVDVILPCNILASFMAEVPSTALRDGLVVLLASIGNQIMAPFYGRLVFKNQSEDRLRSLRYGFVCSNAGFLGTAVVEGVFDALGLLLASIFVIPQRIMVWTEGVAIYSGERDWRAALKKTATHPCVITCFIGLGIMLLHIPVPELIRRPLQTVGRCNTAMAMMMVGMILGGVDLRTVWDKILLRFSLHRLVIIPAIMYLVLTLLQVSPTARGVAVLLTAMPAGATTTILAAKYNREPEFAARMVALSTLLSAPAMFLWSLLVTV